MEEENSKPPSEKQKAGKDADIETRMAAIEDEAEEDREAFESQKQAEADAKAQASFRNSQELAIPADDS